MTQVERLRSSPLEGEGYAGLLNLQAQPHWTVFLSDFALTPADVKSVQRQLASTATRMLFLRIDQELDAILWSLSEAGVNHRTDYVSLQGILWRSLYLSRTHDLFESLPRADLARLELHFPGSKVRRAFATHLLRVVMASDFGEQNEICDRFFALLAKRMPYRVDIRTGADTLEIADQRAWFELAGRLCEGENRTLPGGEVAYTGDSINGIFTVDGALLATPESSKVADEAFRLSRLSAGLQKNPLCFEVRAGQVIDVSGDGTALEAIRTLFRKDQRYRTITEVGVAFNRACRSFEYRWPAPSNEARPGVHIAIGGDPDRRDTTADRGKPLVHVDLMAANCEVFVNGQRFLHASS